MIENQKRAEVLLVDDDELLLESAKLMLKRSYNIKTATSVSLGRATLQNNLIDVVVCDLNFEGHDQDGLIMIDWVAKNHPAIPVIVLSGDSCTRRVVSATERKPLNFIVKSEDYELDLRTAIETGVNIRRQALKTKSKGASFLTQSPKVEKILREIDRVVLGGLNASILITGESGTGKEVLTQYIASAYGKPLTTANMANFPKDLAESELFGHVKGTFTGATADKIGLIEQAHQGVFFLDELGDCSLSIQAKLLRVIQEGELRRLGATSTKKLHIQFIGATNRNLPAMIAAGSFRLDLFQRLNTFSFHLPPLRNRPEDIQAYTSAFLMQLTKDNPFPIRATGMNALLAYHWPGNIRELWNVIQRLVILSDRKVLDGETVNSYIYFNQDRASRSGNTPDTTDARLRILQTLEKTGGNRTRAATILGVDPSTLFRRMKKLGIKDAVTATQGRPNKIMILDANPGAGIQ